MNKIFSSSKNIFINSLNKNFSAFTNTKNNNSGFLQQTKKTFSVDYLDMEKKLEKYYETTNKEIIEKLKSSLTEKQKKEADLIYNHMINLAEEEKDYLKAKLEFEYKKINMNILEDQYTLSNSNEFNPIEIDGNSFGFNENITEKLSSFYGQKGSSSVTVCKFYLFI